MFYLYSCTINIGGLVFDTLHVFLIFTFTARQIFIFYKTNGANRNEQMKQLPISTELLSIFWQSNTILMT